MGDGLAVFTVSCRDTCLVAPINDGADAELKLRHVKSEFMHPSTGVMVNLRKFQHMGYT